MAPFKLSCFAGGGKVPWHPANVFCREKTSGPDRLAVGAAADHVALVTELSRLLPEPFYVLYVLLVSHFDHPVGRYETAAPLTRDQMEAFLREFAPFFEGDGRHHVWVVSPGVDATLVYENHDLVYAYGPLSEFEGALAARGLAPGKVVLPRPHWHHYNAALDHEEKRIVGGFPWTHSPLRPSDDA